MQISNISSHNYALQNTQKTGQTFGAKVTFSEAVKDRYLASISLYEPGYWAKKLKKAQNPIKMLMTKIEEIHPKHNIEIYENKGWNAFNYVKGIGIVNTDGNLVAKNLTTGKVCTSDQYNIRGLLEGIINSENFWEKY